VEDEGGETLRVRARVPRPACAEQGFYRLRFETGR